MADFEILLSESDIRVFETPPYLDTPLCVKANGRYFPDAQWTDFTDEVLSWWAEEYLRNRHGLRPIYNFSFMDGPYRMTARQENDELFLTGINARGREITEFEIVLPVSEFLDELLRAFRKLRRIAFRTDAFRNERDRQSVLESIDHYTERLKAVIDASENSSL